MKFKFWKKPNLNFIYSVDKTFQVIRIMDFNSTEPTCYSTIFADASSGL